jgi:hypothetical protein
MSNSPALHILPSGRSLLDYALAYAKLGFRVLPLHGIVAGRCACGKADCRSPGKHPIAQLAPKGAHSATTDVAALVRWFTDAAIPQRNIAIVFDDSVFAVDIDPRNGGDVTWEALVAKNGEPAETPTARTGGGGSHYLFCRPTGAKLSGTLGKGIDVKGAGGYIVVEPSGHASGQSYCWLAEADPLEGCAIAGAPAWMLAMFASPSVALPAAESTLSDHEVERIRTALPFLKDQIDGYVEWRDIGMALHSTGGGHRALDLWIEASRMSVNFDEDECRRVWRSFTRDKANAITLGTFFHKAKQGGYVPPNAEVVDLPLRRLLNGQTPPPTIVAGPALPDVGPCPASRFAALVDWIKGSYGLDERGATAAAVARPRRDRRAEQWQHRPYSKTQSSRGTRSLCLESA